MKLTFRGAAGEVTGSMHEVESGGKRILLDCGLHQGRRQEADRKNRELGVEASAIDAVILSHAHIDHSGNLPTFVRNGYRGPIYLTKASRELAAVMLESDVKYDESQKRSWCWSQRSLADAKAQHHALTVHWRSDCTYAQKINPGNRESMVCMSMADPPSDAVGDRPARRSKAESSRGIADR